MILDSKLLLQSLRHKVTSFCPKAMCRQLASHWGVLVEGYDFGVAVWDMPGFFGVFDGHGGQQCSSFVARRLTEAREMARGLEVLGVGRGWG